MSDTSLEIAINVNGSDEARAALGGVGTAAQNTGNILTSNRMAFRELGRGMTQLGTAALGVGIAMQESGNSTVKNMGRWVTMAGGIATAIGASMRFVSSIGTVVKGLKDLQLAEIMTQAFSGWGGIAMLGVGAAAAVGVATFASKESSAGHSVQTVNHNIELNGNAVASASRASIIYTQNRNAGTSVIH
jgi:hypothetical protein